MNYYLIVSVKSTKEKEPETQSALLTVLRQEVDRFNRLLSVIHTTLASLKLAVNGEIVMSEQLEEMYKAILSQRVPKGWQVGVFALLSSSFILSFMNLCLGFSCKCFS